MRGRSRPLVRSELVLCPFVVEGFEGEVGSRVVTNVQQLAFMVEVGIERIRLASFLTTHTIRQALLRRRGGR